MYIELSLFPLPYRAKLASGDRKKPITEPMALIAKP